MRKIKTKGAGMMMLRSFGETPKVTMYPYCTACTVLYK